MRCLTEKLSSATLQRSSARSVSEKQTTTALGPPLRVPGVLKPGRYLDRRRPSSRSHAPLLAFGSIADASATITNLRLLVDATPRKEQRTFERRRPPRKMPVATDPGDGEDPRQAAEAPPTEDVDELRCASVMAVPEQYRSFDEDQLFCLFLAVNLKRLPLNQRSLTKIKLLQVLHEAEFGPGDL
ncbi:uncharacterized protein LOC144141548 [Haemaphysalis longicornis]